MRKAITMMFVLVMGLSLYAENNAKDKYGKDGVSVVRSLPDYREPGSRTETYELYMVDSYGDGWNGASLDLFVNGTLVLDDATITVDEGSEAYTTFDVEIGDLVHTEWTEGSWDGECAYGIYDASGNLVAEAGTAENPDLEVSFTV